MIFCKIFLKSKFFSRRVPNGTSTITHALHRKFDYRNLEKGEMLKKFEIRKKFSQRKGSKTNRDRDFFVSERRSAGYSMNDFFWFFIKTRFTLQHQNVPRVVKIAIEGNGKAVDTNNTIRCYVCGEYLEGILGRKRKRGLDVKRCVLTRYQNTDRPVLMPNLMTTLARVIITIISAEKVRARA